MEMNNRPTQVIILLLVLLIGFVSGAVVYSPQNQTDVTKQSYAELYKSASPSVVTIGEENINKSNIGSGFVYKEEYIITSYHVVANTDNITVRYYNGNVTSGEIIGKDPYTDLAVIRPNYIPEESEPLSFSTKMPLPGTKIAIIGSPLNLRNSITTGVVSGTKRSIQGKGGYPLPDLIQTDAPVHSGNSGGPVLLKNGSVVGVVKASSSNTIGYSVSARIAKKVVDDIITTGEVRHPAIGIRAKSISETTKERFNLSSTEGIIVISSNNNKIKKNDVIRSVDGNRIDTVIGLNSYLIRKKHPEEQVVLKIVRNGKVIELEILLKSRQP